MMKNKFFLVLIVAIFLVGFFYFSPVKKSFDRGVFSISAGPSTILSRSGKKIARYFSFAKEISRLRQENKELSEKILSLEVNTNKISELEYENSLLKKEIGFAGENKDSVLLPAKIIGREPTSFLDFFIIDKGTEDGVNVGQAVISGGALVGQIRETYAKQSKVTLITSKDSIIIAMLQTSRAKGILRGGISGLVLEDIIQDVDYKTGEFIITSGLDGQLKPGILIGKARSITSNTSGLFKNILVEPVVDLSKLELVFVMK